MERLLGDRYKIEGKLGAGGMAIVYRAKDTLLERTVAIKVLREQFVSDEAFVKRFRREAQAAASLSHPNIVSIYDVGRDGDIDYIVMEYINGQTLKEVIRANGPLPLQDAVDIVYQVGEALRHAHANNIIHRDIKPQNILVTRDGRAKVTDFGIARAVTSATLTHTGDIIGSVHYLSPEQARGALVTEQSDIYSLGIILYELITGQLPYDGDTPISIALKHLQEVPQMPGQLGNCGELDGVILRAIAKSTNDRYLNAKEFLDDLSRIKAGQPVSYGPGVHDNDMTVLHRGMSNQVQADHQTQAGRKGLPLEDLPKKKGRRLKIGRFEVAPYVVILPAVAILLLIVTLVFFTNYARGTTTDVPNIVGKSITEADAILKEKKLVLNSEFEFAFSEDVPEGIIMAQDPKEGTPTKAGRSVKVTVSKGSESVEMPDVQTGNITLEEAYVKLEREGFKRTQVTVVQKPDERVAEGRVISQNPTAGTLTPKNAAITLEVSTGPNLVMTDYVGYSYYDVQSTLQRMGMVVEVKFVESYTFSKNMIISTDPMAGKQLTKGQKVTITVSSGPGPNP